MLHSAPELGPFLVLAGAERLEEAGHGGHRAPRPRRRQQTRLRVRVALEQWAPHRVFVLHGIHVRAQPTRHHPADPNGWALGEDLALGGAARRVGQLEQKSSKLFRVWVLARPRPALRRVRHERVVRLGGVVRVVPKVEAEFVQQLAPEGRKRHHPLGVIVRVFLQLLLLREFEVDAQPFVKRVFERAQFFRIRLHVDSVLNLPGLGLAPLFGVRVT
mmetsp:Transcript_12721/g.29930  ORF Transcript_12721/g.29930 Transcript_12721/m.29930 type:complete len:217 (+) Transcript_12721:994-1644(+)